MKGSSTMGYTTRWWRGSDKKEERDFYESRTPAITRRPAHAGGGLRAVLHAERGRFDSNGSNRIIAAYLSLVGPVLAPASRPTPYASPARPPQAEAPHRTSVLVLFKVRLFCDPCVLSRLKLQSRSTQRVGSTRSTSRRCARPATRIPAGPARQRSRPRR